VTAGTAHGQNGVVATGHALASATALEMLRGGCNAADAAAAAALALAVVCPHAVTLGGDLFALVYDPGTGAVSGLNASGRAPRAATAARFAGAIPGTGPLAATVPAMLQGIADLLGRHGRSDLGLVLAPAIRLAEEGFPVHRQLAAATSERAALLAKDDAARALFLPGGEPLREGAIFRQPDLARVMRAIAAEGVAAYYRGSIAREIAAASAAKGGLFTAADLADHSSLWQEPIAAPFYGHDILTMPPNSYGATLLLQLKALEAEGISDVDPASADFILKGYAARRAAYRQAGTLIADPRFTEAAVRRLLSAAPASPDGAAPREARDRCTTCAVVIDRDGMAVSLIESISAPYGAGVVLDGTGILLNNRMGGFDADAASANALAPDKRPANTLAPCLVIKDGRIAMSIGTPGTVGQTCTLAQVLARMLACGEDPAAAASAPRWSVDFAGKLIVEDTMEPALRAAVGQRHPELRVVEAGWNSFGSIKLAAVSGAGLLGVADHRRAATALAW
jgi:gamma-glutamyltranspeptidase / glutathione hydrolase